MPFLYEADLLYCPANFCPLLPTRKPIVLTLRNANYFGPGRQAAASSQFRKKVEILLARACVHRADSIVAVSNSLKQDVVLDGFAKEKIRVILSGVPEWPESEEIPAGMQERADFFLSLANDYPTKRLDDLVKAWGLAFESNPLPSQMVLVGEMHGNRRDEQLQIVHPSLRNSLIHLGSISNRSQVKWLLRRARAMISASELESFGLTLVEAGVLGCPAIVTDIPAHREVGSVHVRFFPVGGLRDLADAMLDVRPRALTDNKSRWSWCSWDENASRLGDVFDQLLCIA
ncbi:MAG: glycosyltransferase [Actinomycetota bacterium]